MRAIVHVETASLYAAVPPLQSAYKLHIQFPNITSPHQENRESRPVHPPCGNTSGTHAGMLACARVRILLPKVYLSTVVDHGQNIRLLPAGGVCLSPSLSLAPSPSGPASSNISVVYFHALAQKSSVNNIYSRVSQRICKICAKIRAPQIFSSSRAHGDSVLRCAHFAARQILLNG